MPAYKATYFFESCQRCTTGHNVAVGWTESWYKSGTNLTLEQALLDAQHDVYIAKRREIMPDIYRATFIRVNDDDNPRRFKIRAVTAGVGACATIGGAPFETPVQVAMLVDLMKLPVSAITSEPSHHRRFLIRALCSDLIAGNCPNTVGTSWRKFKDFLDFIGNHESGAFVPSTEKFTWGIRFRDPSVLSQRVVRLEPNADDPHRINITLSNAVISTAGTRVTISGIKDFPEYNRTWTFVESSNSVNHILGTSRHPNAGTYVGPGSGVFHFNGYLYGPLSQYVIIGIRMKKTGRPFSVLRGRRSAR